jgi:hypothetical protein
MDALATPNCPNPPAFDGGRPAHVANAVLRVPAVEGQEAHPTNWPPPRRPLTARWQRRSPAELDQEDRDLRAAARACLALELAPLALSAAVLLGLWVVLR